MSLDAMKKVAAAEGAAKQSLLEAQAKAKQLISDAEAQGKALYERRTLEAEAEAKRLMTEAEKVAADNAADIMHHAENQCAVLTAHGEGKLDAAADRIVERIVMG